MFQSHSFLSQYMLSAAVLYLAVEVISEVLRDCFLQEQLCLVL